MKKVNEEIFQLATKCHVYIINCVLKKTLK